MILMMRKENSQSSLNNLNKQFKILIRKQVYCEFLNEGFYFCNMMLNSTYFYCCVSLISVSYKKNQRFYDSSKINTGIGYIDSEIKQYYHQQRKQAGNMIGKYIGYLMVNSGINRYFHVALLVVQTLQLFLLLIQIEILNNVKQVLLLSAIDQTSILLCFIAVEVLLLGLLVLGGVKFKRQYGQKINEKSYSFIIVTKAIVYLTLLFKTILLLPLTSITINSFKNPSGSSIELALSVIIFLIYFVIIIPLIFIGYLNRIGIRTQTIAYPFFINLDSLVYVYLHVYVTFSALLHVMVPYLHAVFFMLALVVVYNYSILQYKHSQVVSYIYSLIVAFFLVSIANYINNDSDQNFGSCALFILSAFFIAYLLYQFQQITTQQLLMNQIPSKQPPKWYHFHRHRNHNQIFLHLLLNYTKSIDQILIYFFEYQISNTDSESPRNNIFNKLKEGKSKLELFPEIKQFFMKEVMKQYDPSEIDNLGEMEIEKMIHEKGKLSLLIIQLMMIKDEDCILKQNIRKCYCFLKQHEHLVMKVPNNYTFMAKIEIHGMLEILEEELTQTVKNESLTDKYRLKAYEYFEYQEKLQHFKKEISHVCDLNSLFWTEISNEEPDCPKIKNLIRKSHHHSCKVERMFSKLMSSHKRSSIVIYDTLFHFSHLVLNCELSSTFNPFFPINTQYQQELTLWKKENVNHIDSQFSDTYDIPTCMISADKTDRGSILWENSTFRQEYPFMTAMKELAETKTVNIDQLILPFCRAQHELLLNNFSQQESLRFDHGKTIIYKQKESNNVIEMHGIEVQIVPSIKFGLKLLVFIKKTKNRQNESDSENEAQTKLLMVDDQLETSFLSENLVNEWELTDKSDELIHSIIEKLFDKNTGWLNFLKDCESNKSLILEMEHFDYEATLMKTMRNEKGKRHFLFEIRDAFREESPYEKALKAHPQAASCLQAFMHNTMKSLDAMRQKMLDSSVNQYMAPQTQSKDNSIKISLQMDKIMLERDNQQILLQNIFQIMSQPTTPKRIITWRIATVILIVLIMCAMVANMIITSQRQNVYKSDLATIQNYNLLIQYIGRSTISLREYNYWAFTNISSPSLPYYQKELQLYQSVISSLLAKVSGLMTSVWTAYDFQITGKLSMVNETEFGVVTNYILSSLTNLADQPFSNFSFPFLGSEFFWYLGMTQDQTSYINNIYNSLYVALGNMIQTRATLTENIGSQITNILKELYIIPTIIGCLLLVFFITFSFVIETKSNKIVGDTSKLLEIITLKDKKMHLEQIKKFQNMLHSNTFEECKSKQNSQKDQPESNVTTLRQETMSQAEYITDLHSPAITTDRELKIIKQHKKNNTANKKYNSPRHQNDQHQTTTIKISVQSNTKLTLLFYICVVAPFLAYFIGMLIGGMWLNNLIMSYIEFGSQIYYLNSYEEYIYLFTRETFLFERPPYTGFSWGATLIPAMLKIYDSSRYIDANFGFLDQTSKFAQTKLTLDKGNLCNYLYLFEQQSIYYNITFQKSQCERIGNPNRIMTKGFKSAFVYFVQQSVQLLSSNMNPQNLTRKQRIAYLQGSQLGDMKKMLAYFQQFYKVLDKLYQEDIDRIMLYYIELVEIVSIVLILLLFVIVLAVHHRWNVMRNQSKQVQAVLSLISLKYIKEEKSMRERFMDVDYHFYQ